MARSLKFHFIEVEVPDESATFAELIERVAKLPHARERAWQREDDAVYLNEVERNGDVWAGDFFRIRLNDIPLLADLDGRSEDLRLRPDQGIGEETAWLYDQAARVLVIQGTRVGVSPWTAVRYFARLGEHEDELGINVLPVINEGALQALVRMPRPKKLHVRVAGHDQMGRLAHDQKAVRDMLRLPRELQAPVFEFTIHMGRYKGELAGGVKGLARGLARWFGVGSGTADRVTVSGYDEEDRPQVLDLLEAKVVESVRVPDEVGRRVTYATRGDLLRRVWAKRGPGLRARK